MEMAGNNPLPLVTTKKIIQGGIQRVGYIPVLVATFLICFWTVSPAQDILGMFLSGEANYRMMGENPFVTTLGQSYKWQQKITTPSLHFTYQYDNIYHESHSDGTETAIESYRRNVDLFIPVAQNLYQPVLGIHAATARFLAQSNIVKSDGGQYNGDQNRLSISYSMRVSPALQFGVAVGQSYAHPTLFGDYSSNIILHFSPHTLFTLENSNSSNTQLLQLDITGIKGVIPLDYQKQGTRGSLIFDYPAVQVSIRGEQGSITSLAEMNRDWQTQFIPEVRLKAYGVDALFPINNFWSILCRFENDDLQGKGRFTSNGQSYGALSKLWYRNLSSTAGVRYAWSRNALIESHFQWKMINGELMGHVESWPFVSLFDMQISQRENFLASGSAKIWKLHIGSLIPVTDQIQWGIGLSALRLIPQIDIHSWESKFFSYGMRAYEERSLAVRSADFSILSTGFHTMISALEINYAINQFIPISIHRKAEFTGKEIGSTENSTGVISSLQSSGGQFHQLMIEYRF